MDAEVLVGGDVREIGADGVGQKAAAVAATVDVTLKSCILLRIRLLYEMLALLK